MTKLLKKSDETFGGKVDLLSDRVLDLVLVAHFPLRNHYTKHHRSSPINNQRIAQVHCVRYHTVDRQCKCCWDSC